MGPYPDSPSYTSLYRQRESTPREFGRQTMMTVLGFPSQGVLCQGVVTVSSSPGVLTIFSSISMISYRGSKKGISPHKNPLLGVNKNESTANMLQPVIDSATNLLNNLSDYKVYRKVLISFKSRLSTESSSLQHWTLPLLHTNKDSIIYFTPLLSVTVN